jgi:hypothetical protein
LFDEGTLRITNRLIGDSVTVTAGGVLEMLPGSAITINNVLHNYGTLSQTKEIDGTGLVSYFATGDYGGVTIEPNAEDIGDTTVLIRGHQDCENGFTSVQRCFDIQPETNPGTGADLTFYFDVSELNGNNCTSLDVYHWDGADWDSLPVSPANRNCATLPYSVMVENVTDFSPFVLSSVSPTAVTLNTFTTDSATNPFILLPVILLGLITGVLFLIKYKRRRNQFAA